MTMSEVDFTIGDTVSFAVVYETLGGIPTGEVETLTGHIEQIDADFGLYMVRTCPSTYYLQRREDLTNVQGCGTMHQGTQGKGTQ